MSRLRADTLVKGELNWALIRAAFLIRVSSVTMEQRRDREIDQISVATAACTDRERCCLHEGVQEEEENEVERQLEQRRDSKRAGEQRLAQSGERSMKREGERESSRWPFTGPDVD